MPTETELSDRTALFVLAYFWILCLIPLFLRREDGELQWHARNGLALFLVEAAVILVLGLAGLPILLFFKGHGFLFLTGVFFLFWAAVLALHAACVLRALQGGRLFVPGISHWAERI
jgi:uncharacterized membrane protein